MTTKKSPSQSCPAYVCKTLRKIFAKQGWPLAKMSGRYTPFCNAQTGTEGFKVSKVGCSKTVSVYYAAGYANGTTRFMSKEVRMAKEAEARALLEGLGYRFDNSFSGGIYITCDNYDAGDH